MTQVQESVDEGFCWLLCLDIIQTTCAELSQQAGSWFISLLTVPTEFKHTLYVCKISLLTCLNTLQIATEVTQENPASQRYATACLGLTLLHKQQQSWSTASRFKASNHIIAGLAAGNHTVAHMLTAAADANRATTIAQLSQSVQQTEMRTAALEGQVMQARNSPVALYDRALPSRKQQLSTRGAQQYMESITGFTARMTLQKKTGMQKGHSQRLQACWPLDVAPGPEQQVAAFAEVSRGMAPLQSSTSEGPVGRPPISKLHLQTLLSPINEAAASLEVQYWQKVAITVPDKLSTLTLPDIVSKQPSSQQAAVTALQASPSAAYLACGDSSGKLVVLHVTRGVCWVADASTPTHTDTHETAIAGNQHVPVCVKRRKNR